jgi:pyruvate/2-oxoglutarate dehydrogenase complex dihydrolipoamide dehydrogenase (E3) component
MGGEGTMDRYDAIILGAGAAGLAAARGLGRLGARVALIEKETLGGDCIAWGCVPSKSFLHVARLLKLFEHASECGIRGGPVSLDFAGARRFVKGVQETLTRQDTQEFLSGLGVEVLFGSPRLLGERRVEIGDRTLQARHVVLATGARAVAPPVEGLAETGYLDSRSVLQIEALPRSVLVLGGGPIGVEFAQMFQRMGTSVTIVESNPRLLPREEPEAGEYLLNLLQQEGARFLGGRKAVRAMRSPEGKALVLRSPDGNEETVNAEEIVVATGRAPNVDGLDLDRAGVSHDRRGIAVDRAMRTSVQGVWAIGDCNGLYQFVHMAEHEAGVCVKNIVRSRFLPFFQEHMHFRAVAWVTFTDPEVAHCGLTESEARERGIKHHVLRYGFNQLDRAVIENEPGGLAKVITDARGRLLGAHMVGAHAGDLLQELVLGVRLGLKVQDISQTVHPYPAFVQMARRTANVYYVQTLLENPRRLAILKWLGGFGKG